jgi:hypothetical protein
MDTSITGWTSLYDYTIGHTHVLANRGLSTQQTMDDIARMTTLHAGTRDSPKAQSDLSAYIHLMVRSPEVRSAVAAHTSEAMQILTDMHIIPEWMTHYTPQFTEEINTILTSIYIRGYCIMLQREDAHSQHHRKTKQNDIHTDSNADDSHASDDDEDKPLRRHEEPTDETVITTKRGMKLYALCNRIQPGHKPSYAIMNELAAHIYVSRLQSGAFVDSTTVHNVCGIANVHNRIVVIGCTNLETPPICMMFVQHVLALETMLRSISQRLQDGSTYNALLTMKPYPDVSRLTTNNAEFLEGISMLTRQGVQESGDIADATANNKMMNNLLKLNNANLPIRFAAAPPTCDATVLPPQLLDNMLPTVHAIVSSKLTEGLGCVSPANLAKVRDALPIVLAIMRRGMATGSNMLIQLVQAFPALYGLEITESLIVQLTPHARAEVLLGQSFKASILENEQAGGKKLNIDPSPGQYTNQTAKRKNKRKDRDS